MSGISLVFNYRYQSLQSKIDLLIYPTKMATGPGGGAKPYLGGGVGIVRSDMDIKKNAPTQAFIEALAEIGFAELLPQKIDDKGTDFQSALPRMRAWPIL